MKPIVLKRVNHFTLQKHHLTDSSKLSDIPKIVSDIGGLHATASTPPYLSLFARHPSFKKYMLTNELYEKRSLAKIRCVRKTVYIHPKEMLPVLYQATQRSSERASKAFMVRQGVTDETYASLVEKVLQALSTEELTAKELKDKLNEDWNISPMLYYMCDQGLLVRSKPPGGWRDRNHKYAPFRTYFPDLKLDQMDESSATLALVRHYLAAFGPVTEEDIFWWTDLGKTRVRKSLEDMGDEVGDLGAEYLRISELASQRIVGWWAVACGSEAEDGDRFAVDSACGEDGVGSGHIQEGYLAAAQGEG